MTTIPSTGTVRIEIPGDRALSVSAGLVLAVYDVLRASSETGHTVYVAPIRAGTEIVGWDAQLGDVCGEPRPTPYDAIVSLSEALALSEALER